jgi:hypothetical protein
MFEERYFSKPKSDSIYFHQKQIRKFPNISISQFDGFESASQFPGIEMELQFKKLSKIY